jgi:GMP synthase (glutamine-hydrolysing)
MLDGRGPDESSQAEPLRLSPRGTPPAKKPVLVVLHQRHSNPGHVGQWFQQHGHALDIRRPCYDAPLPETLRNHCGAVIFGGPQSANDCDAYIRKEVEWIGVALKENKPFLGICLGAQMLAHHLGAKVDFCKRSCVEIGYHPIRPLNAGLGDMPHIAYQWHREGFEIPRGGQLHAVSDGPFPNQAMSYGGAAVGIQFHPEITHIQVNRWSGSNPMRLLMKGARPREDHLSLHLTHGPVVRRWLNQFLSSWVTGKLSLTVTPQAAVA